MSPEISVIMPLYNAEKYVSTAIQSVIRQTFKNWELIIIDDGSTDSSAKIVAKFLETEPRIVYYQQANKKQAAARNRGFHLAKGQFIAFLDADDLWEETKLQTQLETLISSQTDICYAGGYIIDDGDNIIRPYPTIFGNFSGMEMYIKMLDYNPIPIMAVVMKKSLISKVGLQDESENIHGCEDFDYWLRLARSGATFIGLDKQLFYYRVNPNGTSREVLKMKMAEWYSLFKNAGIETLSSSQKKKLHFRLLEIVRSIIPDLINLKKYLQIGQYFKMLYQLTGSYKYILAGVLMKFSFYKKNALIYYFLHNK